MLYSKELQNGWRPIKVTKDLFQDMRKDRSKYPDHVVGYLEFGYTFGSNWGSGFIGNINDVSRKGRDRISESYRSILKTQKDIKGITFTTGSYEEMEIPVESIIYCDPPYNNSRRFLGTESFNTEAFWEWCRDKGNQGHTVFISEYVAPDDFECIWEKEIIRRVAKNTAGKTAVERLFKHRR